MNAKDAMRQVVEMSHMITRAYVEDLDDKDFVVRAVPGANHIAWQVGHLIASTGQMLSAIGRAAPELPEAFAAAHSRETAACDDPARFRTKAEYLKLTDQTKAATLAAIDATPDDALDQPAPESMREHAPTVGSVLLLLGSHWLMHVGQFVPIRRKLGKAPLF